MPLTSLPTACPTVVLRRAEEARDVRGCCAVGQEPVGPIEQVPALSWSRKNSERSSHRRAKTYAFRCATCRRTRLSTRADHAPGRQLDSPVRRAMPVPLGLAAPALLSRSRATGARTAPRRQGTTRHAPPRRPRPSRRRPASRASLTGPRGSAPTAVGTGRVQTPSCRLPSHVRCDARVETRRFVYSITSRMSRQDGTYRLLSSPVLRPSRRRESSRRATLDAALALLRADGYGAMTIERIAARAGVGKQTIYRWWPSKGAVVFEALLEDLRVSLTFDDTGDLRADLTTQVTSLSRIFASPDGRHMAALIGGAQGDPDLAQALLEHWVRPRRRYAMAFLQQAKDRGQLRPDLDLEVGIDVIWAPLYYRLLLHYAPLDEAHAAAVVDAALTGLAVRSD